MTYNALYVGVNIMGLCMAVDALMGFFVEPLNFSCSAFYYLGIIVTLLLLYNIPLFTRLQSTIYISICTICPGEIKRKKKKILISTPPLVLFLHLIPSVFLPVFYFSSVLHIPNPASLF